jgi:Gluconate 2-dehydrogenase subunit 3
VSEFRGPRLTRRVTLEWMAAMLVASALPRGTWAAASAPVGTAHASSGYGTDPNLKEPIVPWGLIMEPHQLRQAGVLADLMLPGSATAPAPSAVGVADYVNEWVSAPYPEQLSDRATIFKGLRWIDAEAVRRGGRDFVAGGERVRQEILAEIAPKRSGHPLDATSEPAPMGSFFQRFRFLVVSAYYTTPEGFQEIGYIGNAPLAAYPPMTEEERGLLDGALSKLGVGAS